MLWDKSVSVWTKVLIAVYLGGFIVTESLRSMVEPVGWVCIR
jgi:hypothetical protein